MTACASLAVNVPAVSGASTIQSPILLVRGILEPAIVVEQYDVTGPDDRRVASLTVEPAAMTQDPGLLDRLLDADSHLVLPARLNDEQIRQPVLINGILSRTDKVQSAQIDRQQLQLTDHWNQLLDQPASSTWWQTTQGSLLEQQGPAALMIGESANRSNQKWPIGTQQVYVLQENGTAWSVADALAILSALGNLNLSLGLLSRSIAEAPLIRPIDLSRPIGQAMMILLEDYDLAVHRDLNLAGGQLTERRAVRPAERARQVSLAWADQNQPLGQVLKIDSDRQTPRARPWIARSDGYLVESTFVLLPGWDPALEGQPDATYSRENNADFATYANVYRMWVLNEDGLFTAPPYNQGPAFDLINLFAQGAIRAQPLRLLDCLTLDDVGNRREPIVQMSTDEGQTWSAYPTVVDLQPDRAAVYLNDTTLPAAFLTAAKAGDARIRVTASLQSPKPVEVLRWQGNPFAGPAPARVLDTRDAFRFATVATDSIHHASVQSGSLTAKEADDSLALQKWLVDRMARRDAAVDRQLGRATLTLAGAWPMLRVGDRLSDAGGPGRDPANQAEAIVGRGAQLRTLRCRWEGTNSPLTTVELTFS